MINFKQFELSQQLFQKLKKKFPEIELVDIVESPESPNNVWVEIAMPDNDDRERAIGKTASKLSTDILLKYGHHVLISPASPRQRRYADIQPLGDGLLREQPVGYGIYFKKVELAMELFRKLKAKFPAIELLNIVESAENSENTWLKIAVPDDEEQEMKLSEYAGRLSAAILDKYGYSILILQTTRIAQTDAIIHNV